MAKWELDGYDEMAAIILAPNADMELWWKKIMVTGHRTSVLTARQR